MTASTVVVRLLAAAAVAFATLAHADLGFPDYVKLPPQITINPDQRLIKEELADAEFESTKAGSPKISKRGVHYFRWYFYKLAAGEQKPGFYNGTEERIIKAVSGALTPAGWQNVYTAESKDTCGSGAWHVMAGLVAAYERGRTAGAGQLGLIERRQRQYPGAQRACREAGGLHRPRPRFLYLTAWPGSTLKAAGRSPDSLTSPSPSRPAPGLRSPGSRPSTATIGGRPSLSALQFTRDNREALVKAGWTILYPAETDSAGITIVAPT